MSYEQVAEEQMRRFMSVCGVGILLGLWVVVVMLGGALVWSAWGEMHYERGSARLEEAVIQRREDHGLVVTVTTETWTRVRLDVVGVRFRPHQRWVRVEESTATTEEPTTPREGLVRPTIAKGGRQ